MHDIRKIRENPLDFDAQLSRRGHEPSAQNIINLDSDRRAKILASEQAQANKNTISEQVKFAKVNNNIEEFEKLKTLMVEAKSSILNLESEAKEADERLKSFLLTIPNIPSSDVPRGITENENVEIHKWGTPRVFNFEPHEHYLIKGAAGLNFHDAAKISGSRFVILEGAMASLHRALGQFMLNTQIYVHGLIEVWTPVLVNNACMVGTGQLPKFASDSYSISNEQWLIPTSEVSLTNIFSDKILLPTDLPKRLVCHSQCFRSEAGSAGRDTSGMLRQHQFEKVEMVTLCKPEDGKNELDRMTKCAESILQKLEIPYRKVKLCTGDLGFSAKITYDLEVWLPGQNKYREISSCSLCGDFQSRRMNARFRRENNSKPEFIHTLNGSGLAVGRCLIAILENFQNSDGSVNIPKLLTPYMNNKYKINKDGDLE